MIVADTNLIVYFHIQGEHSPLAQAIYETDSEWVAPYLWRNEFRNTLALYYRKSLLTGLQILDLIDRAEFMLSGNEYHVSPRDVITCVMNSRCSAYDCEFVALAQYYGVPLITTDKKILREFPGIALSPDQFLDTL